MKAYVITIKNHNLSNQVADRCIRSAANHGQEVEKFDAITPEHNPGQMMFDRGIDSIRFNEPFSRRENCMAAFLSHMSLWERASEANEDILILEHDAVFRSPVPQMNVNSKVVSLGKPSYGKFNTPKTMFNPVKLMSKEYLPGAHAYVVSKEAAPYLVEAAKERAAPTDLYLSNKNFDFLYEYYPWPIEARDSFTTIQNKLGCQAKHNFDVRYDIV